MSSMSDFDGVNKVTEQDSQASSNSPSDKTNCDDLLSKIQELEILVKEKESRYVYLYAEFENFKKRSIKERSDLLKFGWESIARDLLTTGDNLERAITHIPPHIDSNLQQGLKMVLEQFYSNLQKKGVQPIEAMNKNFDPNLHEAVAQEKSEHPVGTIVKEHVRGYMLHDRLLRAASVTISCGNESVEKEKKGEQI